MQLDSKEAPLKTYPHDIVQRDVLGNSHNQWNLRINRFLYCLPALWCGNEDGGGIWLQFLFGPAEIGQQRQSKMLTFLARCDTSNNVGAIR